MKSTSEIREEKFAMVRRWESSGMKQRVYCDQACIPFGSKSGFFFGGKTESVLDLQAIVASISQ